MNENKLKELYNSEIESSSPDMDALWSRIEEKLPEKQPTESKPVRKPFITLTKALAGIAACAVIAIAIPAVMDTKKSESNTAGINFNYSDAACADEEYIEENGAFAEEDKAAAAADNADITDAPAEEAVSAVSEEMAYFVEDDILVQTECFVDGVVSNVYAESGCVYYELEAKEYYGVEEESSIIIESRSDILMEQGGEYIIPLKVIDGSYRTVCETVPQIKVTDDGGLIYYNGWKTLDNESSENIPYPQGSVDDFFYDRMMFTDSKDISTLIEKWSSLKS